MRILETPRLVLRQLTTADAPFILELLNDPAFMRFIGDRGVRTSAAARQYIVEGPVASYVRYGFGMYLTEQRADGAAIGLSGLVKRDYLDLVDLGFAFLPAYRSQGYASEAALAVMGHARSEYGLARLGGLVSPDNAASIRVLEKIGMRFERLVRASPEAAPVRLYARDL